MFEVGDIVRILPEWCDHKDEALIDSIVTEVNGDRIKIVSKMPHMILPITEVVSDYMIQKVGHVYKKQFTN